MAQSWATAHWEGTLLEGSGTASTASGSIDSAPMTWKARTGGDAGTTPEELLGAAHASCFSMAFSNLLAKAGHPARTLDVTALVDFGPVDDGNAVRSIALSVEGDVPGIDEASFTSIAEEAKVGCPISKALAGNVPIELTVGLRSVA